MIPLTVYPWYVANPFREGFAQRSCFSFQEMVDLWASWLKNQAALFRSSVHHHAAAVAVAADDVVAGAAGSGVAEHAASLNNCLASPGPTQAKF